MPSWKVLAVIVFSAFIMSACGDEEEQGTLGVQGPPGTPGVDGEDGADGGAWKSGTRLKVMRTVYTAEDGLSVSKAEGLWDAQLGVECEGMVTGDGELRCVPTGMTVADAQRFPVFPADTVDPDDEYFTDDACRDRYTATTGWDLYETISPLCGTINFRVVAEREIYVTPIPATLCSEAETGYNYYSVFRARGAQVYYENENGECRPTSLVEVGPEVQPSEMVLMTATTTVVDP